ncbi:unnamed protein product [Nippostrongylus brasiliensis]|uniref:CCHC-type domain-containing protein n=1 Tax=Nippostrongylus brasiliensis TaxID=27835 RepID=A0A0N4XS26_NIPBR|nr:unnamed protein product [Nippostrongylus brasiliensis]
MQSEMDNARVQMNTENHPSILSDMNHAIADLRNTVERALGSVREEMEAQNKKIAELANAARAVNEATEEIGVSLKEMKADTDLWKSGNGKEKEVEATVQPDGELLEDILELDFDESSSTGDKQEVHDSDSEVRKEQTTQTPNAVNGERATITTFLEWRRCMILSEIEDLENTLKGTHRTPMRCITYINVMRPEEEYLRCAFCDEKGQHYSDCCPRYKDVESRKKRIRCYTCLDTLHSTRNCRRSRRKCIYCHSVDHHKAICTAPETRERSEWKLKELRRELADIDSRSGQYHDDRDKRRHVRAEPDDHMSITIN